ncbi:MAG: 2,3-bisphosphoglycerate-independent phosphoglycerate mutase [Firmicutes bacterium]|nr:2,3-bisphosphoglycerate-independent phosphoglycerate mutase [Bacillota bacterium]
MGPLVLCILDGVGIREDSHGNAFASAKKPNFDYLWNNYPHSLLNASGTYVGLPEGQMGNSEVGHLNIGAGRVVYQPLQLINNKITDLSFFKNKEILKAFKHVKKNKSSLHLMGLLSDGGVHSHINHLFALLDMCKQNEIKTVYIHAFTDGRDTAPNSGIKYLEMLENKIKEIGIGEIATISGRYYAMDRDNRWERIDKAYQAIVDGVGEQYSSFQEAMKHNYDNNITDEFIVPAVINKRGIVEDNDAIITFNFRPDRLRELFSLITNPEKAEIECTSLTNIKLITMMPVSDEVVYQNAFNLESLKCTFGEYISHKGLKQLRIAETEKYAHVTYFFDGGVEKSLRNCERVLVPSPKVATYDMQPEMSAYQITKTLIEKLNDYDVVILNYANGDMVGHTGNYEKTVKAVESLDICLAPLFNKLKELNGTLMIIADHGNCDYMLDSNNNQVTSHSNSLVPCIITRKDITLKDGSLCDVAPTLLKLLGLKVPKEMTGNILFEENKKSL